MSRYSLGHRKDERRPDGVVALHRLVGTSAGVPDSVKLTTRDPDNQTSTSSCTGSLGKLLEIWADARGLPCANVSRLATYALGREIAVNDPKAALIDEGAQPAHVVDGMRVFGVCPETAWPFDESKVNYRVPLARLETAYQYRVSRISVIEDAGEMKLAAMRMAIANRYPIACAIPVFQSFFDAPSADVYDRDQGSFAGWHCVRIVGYRPGAFRLLNSWGASWADGGLAWVSDRFVREEASDIYCLEFAPVIA